MRITLLTTAAQGDTYPFLALAIRLIQDGHQVRLAARPDFAGAAGEHDVEFAPVGRPYQPFLAGAAEANALASGHYFNKLRYGLNQRRYVTDGLHEDAWEAVQGSEAIIFKYSWPLGYSLAEKLQVPCAAAMLLPMTPTPSFPNFLVGKGVDRGSRVNRLVWDLTDQAWRQAMRLEDNALRRHQLGLPPRPIWRSTRRRETQVPLLYAYSSAVLGRPPDWPANVHVTGYWFLDPLPRWQPPQALVEFLDAGPPPVSIGFGSMVGQDGRHAMETIIKALDLSGQRGVVLSGWSETRFAQARPDTVYCVEGFIPHQWLFPKMATVMHHGGAGTTGAALRSGRPSIITPFAADQFAWARQLHALGASPPPLAFSNLTAERLATTINQALTDQSIQGRAHELGQKIASEDGLGRAVDLLTAHFSGRRLD